MSSSARVGSLEALTDFRSALVTFAEDASKTLDSVQMAIHSSQNWLEGQKKLWQVEIRRSEEALNEAKNELSRRKMIRIGDRAPDTTEQEKAVRLAARRLDHAQEKQAAVRKWEVALRREVEEYQGPARLLSSFLETDHQRALALLQQQLDALAAYLATLAPPRSSIPPATEIP